MAGFAGKITAVERNPPLALCHRNPRRVADRRAPKLGLVMYSVVNEAATGEDKSPRLEDLPLPDGEFGMHRRGANANGTQAPRPNREGSLPHTFASLSCSVRNEFGGDVETVSQA